MPKKGEADSSVGLFVNILPLNEEIRRVVEVISRVGAIERRFDEEKGARGLGQFNRSDFWVVGISAEQEGSLNLVYAYGANKDKLAILAENDQGHLDLYPVEGASLGAYWLKARGEDEGGVTVRFGKNIEKVRVKSYAPYQDSLEYRFALRSLLYEQDEQENRGRVMLVLTSVIDEQKHNREEQRTYIARMAVSLLGERATEALDLGYGLK